MIDINLDGRKFSPLKNSEGGRVTSDAVFTFAQTEKSFTANYIGQGFTDGHLIGNMTSPDTADLVYHSRAECGDLEVGVAEAKFTADEKGRITIAMNWRWLNGSQKSGTSLYGEIDGT